ncbi:DUF1553 domain-containing protein [Fimbriiglobus ruber]|uniref:Xanthan lyase n=1 Tax=Fimbriiglobus ruber TaxID=1908690 RepID=A0A225DW25_9BACT|nr:DUF1553 domain-containing protein [Fimbriiglobus ruber]OWK45243.1 hypothetical protein FRUB_01574 [Fimbriiglobus ruber]
MRLAASPTGPVFAAAVIALLASHVSVCAADPMDAQKVAFFEQKIRPVLVEQCYKCHSAEAAKNKKLKGGLLLDSRDGLLTGGDSGPALAPGKVAESLLLKSLQYDGDVKMPPAGKLPAAVIADFEKWVRDGAADPRTAQAAPRKQVGPSVAEGRKFWAYQPPKAPTAPAVKQANWPAGDIDRFVLAQLEAKGLKPAADADKAVLVRRLYFDLIGLPPTPEETAAFVRDPDPAAYEKLVDKLLASPQYGERWGRHWLDVARYAESVTLRGLVFPDAWRYRDYVIDAFNRDVPFERFVREQLAGDLLPADTQADRRRLLTATTFLALGNTNLEEQDKKQLRMDVVDEQLDVITKGFLAQTVTCARCHDHKFDPIPTRDYYALAGILRNAKAMEHANVSKWVEVPLPGNPEEEAAIRKHEGAIATLQAKIKTEKARGGPVAARGGLLAVRDVGGVVVDDAAAKKVGEWQHSTFSGSYIGDGYVHDQNAGKGEKTLTFQPEVIPAGKYDVRLAYSSGPSRASAVPVTVCGADGEKEVTVDMRTLPPIDGRYVSLGEYRFEKNGLAYVIVSNEGTTGHVTADAVVFVSLDKAADKTTPTPPAATTKKPGDELKALEAELKRLKETGPKRQHVMSVVEEGRIEDARVHVRGSVQNQGDLVPRGFLQVATAAGKAPTIPKGQSGRRELADWVAARENPLTARVMANRTWHWLFGSGIVRTTDNFGITGELPSNPELLDHLATTFAADGWSVKKLVRQIVLSRAYRQSSVGDKATTAADPDNFLFGRANRRRLEAECVRDTILAVSGQLSPEQGGQTFPATLAADYGYKSASYRRSVYLPMFRNAMPELLELFDAADPSTVTGRRNVSTVAPQSLFMMNHPFVAEQAKQAATKLLAEKLPDDEARITRAYQLTLGRTPTAGEEVVALKFLAAQSTATNESWAQLFHALFASADFRYVD